jgi:hypothetical protein
MTKNQELNYLTAFVENLGPDSYLGPVLSSELLAIESAIRSDYIPEGLMPAIRRNVALLASHQSEVAALQASLKILQDKTAEAKDAARRTITTLQNAADAFDRIVDAGRCAQRNASDVAHTLNALLQ